MLSSLIERAAALHRPGQYQLQAAIAACHAEAPSRAETDWPQILILYDMLVRRSPSPIARLNRAVALRRAEQRALALTHNPAEQSLLRRRLAVDAC